MTVRLAGAEEVVPALDGASCFIQAPFRYHGGACGQGGLASIPRCG